MKTLDQEQLARRAPALAATPADDAVGHAVRVFCGNEPDLHAAQTIRLAFAAAHREGHLRYFVENCSALCGRRLKGAARAQAVQSLGDLPIVLWPFVASSAHAALEPTMRPMDVSDLVKAVAKLLALR